jgi:hypothetical protein
MTRLPRADSKPKVVQGRACGKAVALGTAAAVTLSFWGCAGDDPREPTEVKLDAGDNAASAENPFELTPPRLYSAFVPGHSFVAPVEADVDIARWQSSDDSVVMIEAIGEREAHIHVKKAGRPVQITAIDEEGREARALLTITAGSEEQWAVGTARYNNGENPFRQPSTPEEQAELMRRLDEALRNMVPAASVTRNTKAGCAYCHGELAPTFIKVHHTPKQTAGYSDEDLVGIITTGKKPPGYRASSDRLSRVDWKYTHRWDVTASDLKGIILYLRSLTPKAQLTEDDRMRGGGGPMIGGEPPPVPDGGEQPPSRRPMPAEDRSAFAPSRHTLDGGSSPRW